MVIWGTALQEHVPPNMLGRVASLDFFISVAFMPLSIAVTGILSQYLEPRVLFLGAGLLPMGAAASLAIVGQLRTPSPAVQEDEV